jgi:UDP-N-acetylmuramate: L-alanyl-gamma-D-glutamyl-meso-diaminopimelate ligase
MYQKLILITDFNLLIYIALNHTGANMQYWIIGIGGVAMGSLAVCLSQAGHNVSGSDLALYPPMSDYLANSGIIWKEKFCKSHIESLSSEDCMVIVGNAIPRGNPELEAALSNGFQLQSMPEIIRSEFIRGKHSIVVSGTHGKTTTANLATVVLENAGQKPGWLIGGKPWGLDVSMREAIAEKAPFVIEGDEYDTVFYDKRSKFFHYWPQTLIINHIEFDHSDIFENLEQIKTAFIRLVNMVPDNGLIIANGDSEHVIEACAKAIAPVVFFGKGDNCTYRLIAENCNEDLSSFELMVPAEQERQTLKIENTNANDSEIKSTMPADLRPYTVSSPLQGEYNGMNIMAALAMADSLGVSRGSFNSSCLEFKGPARRMDRYLLNNGLVLFDDFAHHPTAVKGVIHSLRERFPDRKITVIFEPRSNTSVTDVMQDEWQSSLCHADKVAMGGLHRPWKYERLFDFEKMRAHCEAAGVLFFQNDEPGVLAKWLLDVCNPKEDIAVICSNGSFGGLKEILVGG